MRLRWVIVAVVIVLAGTGLFMQQCARMKRIQEAERAAALRDVLALMRNAIQKFHADKGRYPHDLNELVPDYLRRVPADPMTRSVSWRLTTEETVQPSDDFAATAAPKSESVIIDVHSSAPGFGEY